MFLRAHLTGAELGSKQLVLFLPGDVPPVIWAFVRFQVLFLVALIANLSILILLETAPFPTEVGLFKTFRNLNAPKAAEMYWICKSTTRERFAA